MPRLKKERSNWTPDEIRQARLRLDMKQTCFADLIAAVNQTVVSKLESGQRKLYKHEEGRIMQALNNRQAVRF